VAARQLFMLGDEGSIVAAGSPLPLTGSRTSVHAASSALSDALPLGNRIFLAAAGGVTVYDLAARRVAGRFSTGSGPNTRLAALINGIPVTYDGNGAWYGETDLSVGGARVI